MTASTDRAAILASLSRSLREAEGRAPDDDNDDATTVLGDRIAGVRDYIESTQDSITGTALAEVAYAFLAGIDYATSGDRDDYTTRAAYAALRKAGLSL